MDEFGKVALVGQVFTPGSPVNERDLFAGRVDQLRRILDAVTQRGYHAVLYGERGVGKTSLANMLVKILPEHTYCVAKVNCDAADTFGSVWRKALRDLTVTQSFQGVGFAAPVTKESVSLADLLPDEPQPDDVRRVLASLGTDRETLIILDEYDRITDQATSVQISDTIKGLSDFGVSASLLLIGVARSIEELIKGHQSIERALVQIAMPRMSNDEIDQILDKGLERISLTVSASARSHLLSLSQGLPYIAHLLALHSARAAIYSGAEEIDRVHVDRGIEFALEQWQESIKMAYYDAVKSQQPGNIYREVLLACAMAEVDDLGYFTAASIRTPLSRIAQRSLDIPNFARHLKEFSEPGRGDLIQRVGVERKFRYRFNSPLMRPYIIMRAYAEGMLK